MMWKRFIVSVCFALAVHTIFGCMWIETPMDELYTFKSYNIMNKGDYSPWYSWYEETESQRADNDANVAFWHTYTKGQVDKMSIFKALYQLPHSAIDNGNNPFFAYRVYFSSSIILTRSPLRCRPTRVSTTSPFFMKTSMGMLRTPNCMAISLFSSVSHLAMTTSSLYSSANSSMMGESARQGPHHVAQKSIMTNLSLLMTCSKLSELICNAITLVF